MLKTKSRQFNISSSIGRLNGDYCSSIQIQLPDLAFHHDNIQNAYLSVIHAEVPNSFYILNYTNNQFVLDGVTYTLTRGNYNVNTFMTMLLAAIPANFGITYSSITTKFTMTKSTGSFTINAASTASTINSVMGLGSANITSSIVGSIQTIIMPNVCNFIPLQRINFRATLLNFGCYNSVDGSSDIFLPLQNNAGQNSIINYVNQAHTQFLVQSRNITSFVINVTDDKGRYINFNGVDWLMTLQIDTEYLEQPRLSSFGSIVQNPNINL
jgi:hypothetical protein